MRVTREKVRAESERLTLLGMIASDDFMEKAVHFAEVSLFSSQITKTIATWCLKFWAEYQQTPKEHLRDLMESKLRSGEIMEEDEAPLVQLITSLLTEAKRADKLNVDYLLDTAEDFLRKRKLEITTQDIKAALVSGQVDDAEALIAKYKTVSRTTSQGIDPYLDKDLIQQAFEERAEVLFQMPGALGDLMNQHLCRDCFISFMGPEKIGKTWWMVEMGMQALRQRCNVAFFSVGDMSERQMIMRMMIRLCGKSDLPKYCGKFLMPVLDCKYNQDDSCSEKCRCCSIGVMGANDKPVLFEDASDDYKPCTECLREGGQKSKFSGAIWWERKHIKEPLTWSEAYQKSQEFRKRLGNTQIRLVTTPVNTTNVQDIETQLGLWEGLEGFIPDVIIIDYADIMADEPNTSKETRDRENARWKALRALSQKYHCLVITATQSNTSSYKSYLIRREHFSEDKRKLAHVTAMFGLNQTTSEKRLGMYRINEVLARESDNDVERTVTVLSSLRMGRPYLSSFWTW